MITMMQHDFALAIAQAEQPPKQTRKVTIATGELAYPMMQKFSQQVSERFPQVTVQVRKIVNDFFGHSVTVAGLVTGQDLLAQLEDIQIGEQLLIPANMLRHEQDRFLDDITLTEVSERLGVEVVPVENDAFELLDRMLGVSFAC